MVGWRPSVDTLPVGINKIKVARRIGCSSRDVVKAAGQFFHLCARGQNAAWSRNSRRRLHDGRGRIAGKIQPGELALTYFDVSCLLINRIIKCDLAVAIAVNIPEPDIGRVRDLDRPWKRLKAADYAINVEVGNGDVVRAFDFKGQSGAAFATLFFSLKRVNPPVRNIVQLNFTTDMMFARQFVNASL